MNTNSIIINMLKGMYYNLRQFIPDKILYHKDLFYVINMSAKCENDFDLINKITTYKLKEILKESIAHVPFYRNNVKITINDITNHEDVCELIKEFPYLEKSTVMENKELFLNELYKNKPIYYMTSGGSSGQGIGIFRNKRLSDIEKAFFLSEWRKFGFSFNKSRYLRIGADAKRHESQSPLWKYGNRLMLSPYHINERWIKYIKIVINEYKPEFIHAYPSALFDLCMLMKDDEFDFIPKCIFLASEPVLNHQISMIYNKLKCQVSINYGLTERTNIAFSTYENKIIMPYRLNRLYSFNENKEHDGRFEIIGTSLWNNIMPLIRYCTSDYGFINDDFEIHDLEGRKQEFIIDKLGNKIPGLSIDIDNNVWDFIRSYQIKQDTIGKIVLCVVPKHKSLTSDQKEILIKTQSKHLGSFFDIDIEESESIPLTKNGKRRLIISKIA